MKAPTKKIPLWAKLVARLIAIPPRVFRTRHDPVPGYLAPVAIGSCPGLLLSWILWSLWRPIDWLLYGEWYESLTRNLASSPSITMGKPGAPPPSYRQVCGFLSALSLPDPDLF